MSKHCTRVMWAVVAGAAVLFGVAAWAGVQTPPEPLLDNGWLDALDLVRQGDAGVDRLNGSMALDDRAPLRRVAKWLAERAELEQSRASMTRDEFDMYVARVKKWHGRNKIAKALEYALLAYHNTTDKEAFCRQPWLLKLRADAVAKAEEHKANEEWLDAHALFYELSEIYLHDEDLKKQRQVCLTHARLEEVYTKDSKWDEMLQGIDPEMVTEAMWRIDQKYVEEADFRAMTIAGLQQVLLLAQSPAMHELFEFLNDTARRQEFEARVGVRLNQAKNAPSLDRSEAVAFFNHMMKINRQTVQLPEALLAREFMDGSLEELDEFTSVIWPVDYKEFQKHTRGNFIGVGISIRQKYDEETECNNVVVVTPLEDTPAYYAGIQADDIITHVDGKSLCELDVSLSKAVEMITGPEGTHVTLTIHRPSVGKDIDFRLERKRVDLPSVKAIERDAKDEQKWNYMLDPELGIGYARVTNFQENTAGELRDVIAELQRKHSLRGFILDLRFNPGGLLTSAVQMAELFLGKGETIVSTRGLRSRPWEIPVEEDGPFKDLPLIVLVNEFSASASEIVSGAIKDHGRGLVIGERTFGKFSVQNLIQLVRSDAHLKLTTAHYYLPSGRCLHRENDSTEWGVQPDLEVALVPKELKKVLDIRRDADIIGPRGQADDDERKDEAAAESPKAEENEKPDGADANVPGTTEGTTGDADKPESKDDDGPPTTQPAEEEEDEPDPNNRPAIDPQLETALLLIRIRILSEDFPVIAQLSRATTPPSTPRVRSPVPKSKVSAQ